MNYNRIDILDKGTVWQGGSVDATIDAAPFTGPILIVCMDKGETNEQWIDHTTVEAVLAVWIDDTPTATLKDGVLVGLVDAALAWLDGGGNVYIHCQMGVSRASYFDIALHMRANRWTYQQAHDAIIAQRPIIDPNPGFVAHLQRLEPVLTAGRPQ